MSEQISVDSEDITTKVKLLSFYFISIMLVHAFMNFGSILIDVSRTLYVQSLGGSASLSGLTLFLTATSATVMRLVSGKASDLVGRRALIVLGLTIFSLSAVSLNLFPYLGTVPVTCLMRGIGMGMAGTAAAAAITDVAPRERMGEALGYFGLTNPLANAVVPVFATKLIEVGNYRAIFYSAALFLFAGAVVMFFCNYEKDSKFLSRQQMVPLASKTEKSTEPELGAPRGLAAFFEKSALPCAALHLLVAMAQGANLSFLMAYATYIAVPNPALFYTFYAAFMVICRVLSAKYCDRYKPVYLVVIGFGMSLVSFSCLLFAGQNTILYYISGVSTGIAMGLYAPVLQATAVRLSPDNRRGTAMATFMFTMDIGIAVGSLIWGALVDKWGYSAMYIGCLICICSAIVLAIILLRKVARPQGRFTTPCRSFP